LASQRDGDDDDDDFFYRPQRARGERFDPILKRLTLSGAGVALVVSLLALAYSGGRPSAFGPPPIINPPDTPLRVAPANPGGMQLPGANMPILSGDDGSQTQAQLAPQAAAPEVAQLDQAAGMNAAPPVAQTASAPAVAAATAPVVASTPHPAEAAEPPKPAEVQIAATPDEGGAESAWAKARTAAPTLLAGKTPFILPDVVNGQSVWRVRLGGFSSADAASAFCAQLIATGAGCTVLP